MNTRRGSIALLSLRRPHQPQDLPRFLDAAKKMNVQLEVYHPSDLHIRVRKGLSSLLNRDMKPARFDAVINWIPYPTTSELNLVCDQLGIPFFNSTAAIRVAQNKMLSSLMWGASGLPHPDTFLAAQSHKAVGIPPLAFPLVLKPKTGTHGHHSLILESWQELGVPMNRRVLAQDIYLQEFVANCGWYLRVMVVGGRALGAIKKTVRPGGWRTHIEQGRRAEPFPLSDDLASLACDAAKVLGLVVSGMDIIADFDGRYLLLEANGVPGLRIFETTTQISAAGAIIEHALGLARGDLF